MKISTLCSLSLSTAFFLCLALAAPIGATSHAASAQNTATANGVVTGKLNDANGPIANANVTLNAFADEKCVKLFLSHKYSEKVVQQLEECMTDIGPVKPDENGVYRFENLKPGHYALVVAWNLSPKLKKPIMAFQKGDFVISYFENAPFNAVATGKPFQLAASATATQDFDYTKGQITKEISPK
jgi:uncharacterized Rmd1/YagE family protein